MCLRFCADADVIAHLTANCAAVELGHIFTEDRHGRATIEFLMNDYGNKMISYALVSYLR